MPRRRLAAVAALAALALCAPATARAADCAGADVVPAADNVAVVGQATLCLLNQQRAAHGVGPLAENAAAHERLGGLLAADGRAGLLRPRVARRRHAGRPPDRRRLPRRRRPMARGREHRLGPGRARHARARWSARGWAARATARTCSAATTPRSASGWRSGRRSTTAGAPPTPPTSARAQATAAAQAARARKAAPRARPQPAGRVRPRRGGHGPQRALARSRARPAPAPARRGYDAADRPHRASGRVSYPQPPCRAALASQHSSPSRRRSRRAGARPAQHLPSANPPGAVQLSDERPTTRWAHTADVQPVFSRPSEQAHRVAAPAPAHRGQVPRGLRGARALEERRRATRG